MINRILLVVALNSAASLGFSGLYPGLGVEYEGSGKRLELRTSAMALKSTKEGTTGGWGVRSEALVGVRVASGFSLFAGGEYNYQSTWDKEDYAPILAAEWRNNKMIAMLQWRPPIDKQVEEVYALSLSNNGRYRFGIGYEYVKFTDFFGVQRSGEKVMVEYKWRFK